MSGLAAARAAPCAPAVAARTSAGASSSLARTPASTGVSGRSWNRRLASETGAGPLRVASRALPRVAAAGTALGGSSDHDEFAPKSRPKPRAEVVAAAVSVPSVQSVEDEFRDRADSLADGENDAAEKTENRARRGGARRGDPRTAAHQEGVRQGWPLAKLLESLPPIPVVDTTGGEGEKAPDRSDAASSDSAAGAAAPPRMTASESSAHLRLYETLVEHGRLHNALELLRALRSAGVQKLGARVSHKNFLRQCARREAVAVAFEFVAFVDTRDVRVYNMLLSACARAGDARAGFAAFVMMYDAGVAPDCRAYTTLISACAKAGDAEKAFETFRRMEMDNVEPSVVTYGALMDALSRRVLELTMKRRAHGGAAVGSRSDALAPSAVAVEAGAAATAGASAADASASAPDAVAEEVARTLRRCFALREEMDDAGIAPDECVLNSLVSACARAAVCDAVAKDALRRAFAVYDEMERGRGFSCDAYTYASLIAGCVNAGEPERALELYRKSGEKQVKRTAAVFAAAAHACGSDALPGGPDLPRALDVWRDMRAEGVAPDAMLYATLVDVAGRAGERRVAERVTAEMERDGTPPTAAVFAALAGVAAREGDVEGVERILADMTQRGVHPVREVFAALVAAAARRADAEAAGAAAARARAAGFDDDPATIESLVRVCASAGRADLAWGHYRRATGEDEASTTPPPRFALTRGTYTALVVASGRAGELRRAFEAADLMRAAGYEPDDTTWRELLSSCARAGDADLAWRTYKQSRESGCPPNDVALNIIVGVTLLKIRELTDPENRANKRQQIDADAAALVDPETGERAFASAAGRYGEGGHAASARKRDAEPEWKEWADRAIAVYHEATVAGVRPRLATFSAMLACLRPPTLPALRAVDASEAGREGAGVGRLARAVAREDDAHEDARKYYPLRALILYEEAQALGVVPKFQLGGGGEPGGDTNHPADSEYDIRGFPPAAAEVAVLTLLRVFRRYSDAHAGDEDPPELPGVTLRVLSDSETDAMSDSAADRRLARTGDRVVVLLRRLRFNYGGSLERGRIELSGHVISRWLKAKPTPRADGLPGTEPRLAGGALTDQAMRIRARGLGGADDFGFAPRSAPGSGLGSGASGVDFFGADDQRYSADDGEDLAGGGLYGRRARRSWSRGGSRDSRDSRDGDDGDCMMSELSRITGSSGSRSYDDASVDEEGYYD